MTRWVLGSLRWISTMRSMASTSPVGALVNLYAPWLVPIAIASASHPVCCDEVGSLVGIGEHLVARELALGAHAVLLARLAGLERLPRTPSSPSTVTPTACAMRQTSFVTSTLYS